MPLTEQKGGYIIHLTQIVDSKKNEAGQLPV
jgi:hypothetical protein